MKKRFSIRLRLTLWFALLMLGLVATVLAFLLAVGERVVVDATHAQLMDAVAQSRNDIEYEYGVLDMDDDLKMYKLGVSLSVYDEKGRILYGRVPRGMPPDVPFVAGDVRTVGDDPQDWYVYDMLYHQDGFGPIWLRGTMPASGINATFTALFRLAFLLLPLLAVLAALGGYWMACRAFRPVRKIIETAEKIRADGDLSRRIALTSGTTNTRDELLALAAVFDRLFDRLQDAFEKERQFTSDASHELRTPVSVIVAQCEDALASAKTEDEWRAATSTVLSQAHHMSTLIAHLLTFARADRGLTELNRETLDFSGLAEAVAEQIREQADEKNIRVVCEIEPGINIMGDEALLIRLLWNLLENGIKYGRPGGTLKFDVRKTGGTVTGRVTDDGIGIAPEHLGKIWERFYRVSSARGGQAGGGFGLGLTLARYIAQAHGGDISVQSVYREGSVFTFTLPLK